MAKSRQGARPASSPIEVTFNNRTLAEAKIVFDRLAAERFFVDLQVKVEIGRIYQELKTLFAPLNDTVLDLLDELGEGEEDNKKIRPGSAADRRFQRSHSELMERGEYKITVKPIKYSDLMVKKRNEQGEREDELFDLSADEIIKAGPLLVID